MRNEANLQPPQHFLQLIGRLYQKRERILESSNHLVDYSYELQNCTNSELELISKKIMKELNTIISDLNELSPVLDNPQIINPVWELVRLMNLELETLKISKTGRNKAALNLRTFICPTVVMTRLKLTPKSIKQAFGITLSKNDIKLLYEHQQDNY